MNNNIDKISVQEAYGEKFQHCFGCGIKNEFGLKLKSYPNGDGNMCICEFTPDDKFSGGVPKNLFGGMIAMIFDCHGTASAAWFNHHNKGLILDKNTIIQRYITARLEIDYKKPTPLQKKIKVISELEEIHERKIILNMTMEVENIITAKAKMVAVKIID